MTLCHCTAAVCDVRPDVAYAFLADPASLGTWALGCWDATPVGEDGARGTSLFDGEECVVRLIPAPEVGLVDYVVGGEQAALPRISARVVPAVVVGGSDDQCVVTLLAYRTVDMTPERWARLGATHEVEIHLLKARLEESRNRERSGASARP
jgi:hypothetical protein